MKLYSQAMKKLFSIIAILLIYAGSVNAQSKNPASYENKFGKFYFHRFDDASSKALDSLKEVYTHVIIFSTQCTQADFDKLCKQATWIKKLEVQTGNPHINNIEALTNIKSLRQLSIQNLISSKTKPLDLGPLKKHSKINKLILAHTKVTNTEALNKLSNLGYLVLRDSDVSSIEFLTHTRHLGLLDLMGGGHTFLNYDPLTNLTELRSLNIYYNTQATDENLTVLENLTKLDYIALGATKNVTHLNFLKNSLTIKKIYAETCENLSDISVVKNFKKLEQLGIKGAPISSIYDLSEITSLVILNISGSKVAEISALKNASNLKRLNVSQTPVIDITPLYNCSKLIVLRITDNVSEEQIKEIKSMHPHLRVDIKELPNNRAKVNDTLKGKANTAKTGIEPIPTEATETAKEGLGELLSLFTRKGFTEIVRERYTKMPVDTTEEFTRNMIEVIRNRYSDDKKNKQITTLLSKALKSEPVIKTADSRRGKESGTCAEFSMGEGKKPLRIYLTIEGVWGLRSL